MPLTVDDGLKVTAAYGARRPLGGTARTVVIIDKAGRVRWVERGLPETETVLAELDRVQASQGL